MDSPVNLSKVNLEKRRLKPIKCAVCDGKYLKTRDKQEMCLVCLKIRDPKEYERTYPFKITPTVLLKNAQTEQKILNIKNVVGAELGQDSGRNQV